MYVCMWLGSKAASGLQERLLGETVVYSPLVASAHTYTGLQEEEEESEEDNIASVDQFAEQFVKESQVCSSI